jgi:hypothetical protein
MELEKVEGNGASLLTLCVSKDDKLARVIKMLEEECTTANNIKSRVNRNQVIECIANCLQFIKHAYLPIQSEDGFMFYCGRDKNNKFINVYTSGYEGKTTYLIDNKFHLLKDKITDGNPDISLKEKEIKNVCSYLKINKDHFENHMNCKIVEAGIINKPFARLLYKTKSHSTYTYFRDRTNCLHDVNTLEKSEDGTKLCEALFYYQQV